MQSSDAKAGWRGTCRCGLPCQLPAYPSAPLVKVDSVLIIGLNSVTHPDHNLQDDRTSPGPAWPAFPPAADVSTPSAAMSGASPCPHSLYARKPTLKDCHCYNRVLTKASPSKQAQAGDVRLGRDSAVIIGVKFVRSFYYNI